MNVNTKEKTLGGQEEKILIGTRLKRKPMFIWETWICVTWSTR